MLTIKPPIELKCRNSLETVHKDLSEKIIGNYTLMNNFIRKEELLYVTTQAPEVYFAEGNNISILNDIKNENNQEIKLDVINHLINRILMSGTENFSYQDTVYVSNVLRKLGIQDVNNFMKQVYKLQEERKENNKLINIYEEQKELLSFSETQADRLGSVFLMPRFILKRVMKKYGCEECLNVYGWNVFAPEDKIKLRKIADCMGVSYQALVIRLKTLGWLIPHDLTEYLEKDLQLGGVL